MRISSGFAGLVVGVACLGGDGRGPGYPQSARLARPGRPATVAATGQSFPVRPWIIPPRSGSDRSIIVIRPNPAVGYKIVQIPADSSIDPKMVIDAGSGDRIADLGRQIEEAFRKKLLEQQRHGMR
jgi:hypothetical protein